MLRKLQNIIWVHDWIEGLRFLGLGLFDTLECSGVLHHLKSPILGLNLLKDALFCKGGLSLMVYGKYGRTSIYHMQHIMTMVNSNQELTNEDINQ